MSVVVALQLEVKHLRLSRACRWDEVLVHHREDAATDFQEIRSHFRDGLPLVNGLLVVPLGFSLPALRWRCCARLLVDCRRLSALLPTRARAHVRALQCPTGVLLSQHGSSQPPQEHWRVSGKNCGADKCEWKGGPLNCVVRVDNLFFGANS